MSQRYSLKKIANHLWLINIFRDPSIRNSTMLLCGILMGTARYFDYLERDPFSPLVALTGLVAGLFSVSVRQCVQNALLSNFGFVLSFFLIHLFNGLVLVSSGGEVAALMEILGDRLIVAVLSAPLMHATWILAMPVGYGLRRMVKGERVKKDKSKRSKRR